MAETGDTSNLLRVADYRVKPLASSFRTIVQVVDNAAAWEIAETAMYLCSRICDLPLAAMPIPNNVSWSTVTWGHEGVYRLVLQMPYGTNHVLGANLYSPGRTSGTPLILSGNSRGDHIDYAEPIDLSAYKGLASVPLSILRSFFASWALSDAYAKIERSIREASLVAH